MLYGAMTLIPCCVNHKKHDMHVYNGAEIRAIYMSVTILAFGQSIGNIHQCHLLCKTNRLQIESTQVVRIDIQYTGYTE